MARLRILRGVDGEETAAEVRRALALPRDRAAALGASALQASRDGRYRNARGEPVDAPLPRPPRERFAEMTVTVANETTMSAGRALVESGGSTLALNFANGVNPGGGFLGGARAQEEVLCRSSALYVTLEGDPSHPLPTRPVLPDR